MVVPYHSAVGRFGDRLAKPFRCGLLAQRRTQGSFRKMPSFNGKLTGEQVDQLVGYIREIGETEVAAFRASGYFRRAAAFAARCPRRSFAPNSRQLI
jgi:hypothetical protein